MSETLIIKDENQRGENSPRFFVIEKNSPRNKEDQIQFLARNLLMSMEAEGSILTDVTSSNHDDKHLTEEEIFNIAIDYSINGQDVEEIDYSAIDIEKFTRISCLLRSGAMIIKICNNEIASDVIETLEKEIPSLLEI